MFYRQKLNDGHVHEFESREIYDDRRTRLVNIMRSLVKLHPDQYKMEYKKKGKVVFSQLRDDGVCVTAFPIFELE